MAGESPETKRSDSKQRRESLGYVDAASVTLRTDHKLKLHATINGQDFEDVGLARAFPLSDPNRYIAIMDTDGAEVAMLKTTTALDPESREAFEWHMARLYFSPRIVRIEGINEKYGVFTWLVETDRGRREFHVRERENVRVLPPRRVVVEDVDQNTFQIPDYEELDRRSLDLLEQVL